VDLLRNRRAAVCRTRQRSRAPRAAAPADLAWMVHLGVFPTSVAFTTWAYALARGTASRLVTLAYLVPPITIGMSWLILDEVPRGRCRRPPVSGRRIRRTAPE
jgi:uncharacterized membrane protein